MQTTYRSNNNNNIAYKKYSSHNEVEKNSE